MKSAGDSVLTSEFKVDHYRLCRNREEPVRAGHRRCADGLARYNIEP